MFEGIKYKINKIADKKYGKKDSSFLFFRCRSCKKVFPIKYIAKEGWCSKCGCARFSPAKLSILEELKFLIRLIYE